MSKVKDNTGKRFGRLLVIDLQGIKNGKSSWNCICDCGNKTIVCCYNLTSGHTKSCGCLRELCIGKPFEKGNKIGTTHGGTNTRLYKIWENMLQRCTNPNVPSYRWYGGKGVIVCDEWRDFTSFSRDMGEPPSVDYTLDRIDSTKGYCKENCRWATRKEQSRNKGSNYFISYKNKTQIVTDWAKEIGLSVSSISYRLRQGWSVEKTFETPAYSRARIITLRGEARSFKEWTKILKLNSGTVYARLTRGWSIEEAFGIQ